MQRGVVATGEAKAKGFSLLVRGMEDIEEREIEWLWPAHLARGMVHILGGHPGDGKSTLTTAIAATLSNGGVWPDSTPAPSGKTLFLLGEDAPDSVVKPRLLRHGARQPMVRFIEAVQEPGGKERLFDLGKHLETLEPYIVAEGIDLLVIDPLSSFMAGARRNDEGDVRDLLQPLVKMAERTGVAVLCVMHIGKPNGTNRRAAQQLLGSTGFVGLARVVLMVAPQTSDAQDTRRVLAVVKTNIGVRPPGREFDIAGNVVAWGGECRESIETLLAGTDTTADGKVGAAAAFTRTTLEAHGGAMLSTELQRMAEMAGFSKATSRRAREQLGLQFHKGTGKTAQYHTSLPGRQPQGVNGLFNPLDTAMNNLCLPFPNTENTGCSSEQFEQPVGKQWDSRVVHQEPPMNNLCLPLPNKENAQSNSQVVQVAHVSQGEHAVAANRRIAYCDNALTAAEMATEGAWEEWLNIQHRHHDAAIGAWPMLTAH